MIGPPIKKIENYLDRDMKTIENMLGLFHFWSIESRVFCMALSAEGCA